MQQPPVVHKGVITWAGTLGAERGGGERCVCSCLDTGIMDRVPCPNAKGLTSTAAACTHAFHGVLVTVLVNGYRPSHNADSSAVPLVWQSYRHAHIPPFIM